MSTLVLLRRSLGEDSRIVILRVLVAEDEPNVGESIAFVLGRAGCDVTVEANGDAALGHALASPPDLLVLDAMLPGMNGYDILRRLRADARTQALPVIMLTAKTQAEDRELAMSCGADHFMPKPYANADLVAAVERFGRAG